MCVYVNCACVCVYVDRLIYIMYLRFYFTGSVAKAEMEHLRQAMPYISQVLRKLHINPNNSKLSMYYRISDSEMLSVGVRPFRLHLSGTSL